MDIRILQLIEGAQNAEGFTVIIDVFRAFSLACYAAHAGVSKIIPVADIQLARSLKVRNPDYLLVGERNEQKPADFDFGNSPYQLIQTDLLDKTLIHTTSAGTQGIINARKASRIVTGSLVNAHAIVKAIKRAQPETVSLVCMGYSATEPSDEDTFCAEYIRALLLGNTVDVNPSIEKLRKGAGARFFMPEKQSYAPWQDFYLCTRVGVFDFVMEAQRDENGLLFLKKLLM